MPPPTCTRQHPYTPAHAPPPPPARADTPASPPTCTRPRCLGGGAAKSARALPNATLPGVQHRVVQQHLQRGAAEPLSPAALSCPVICYVYICLIVHEWQGWLGSQSRRQLSLLALVSIRYRLMMPYGLLAILRDMWQWLHVKLKSCMLFATRRSSRRQALSTKALQNITCNVMPPGPASVSSWLSASTPAPWRPSQPGPRQR